MGDEKCEHLMNEVSEVLRAEWEIHVKFMKSRTCTEFDSMVETNKVADFASFQLIVHLFMCRFEFVVL